jgi:hypothetical protein
MNRRHRRTVARLTRPCAEGPATRGRGSNDLLLSSCSQLEHFRLATAGDSQEASARPQAGGLGLRLYVDHLIEPKDLEHHAHRVRRGDDDQPATEPVDPFVELK